MRLLSSLSRRRRGGSRMRQLLNLRSSSPSLPLDVRPGSRRSSPPQLLPGSSRARLDARLASRRDTLHVLLWGGSRERHLVRPAPRRGHVLLRGGGRLPLRTRLLRCRRHVLLWASSWLQLNTCLASCLVRPEVLLQGISRLRLNVRLNSSWRILHLLLALRGSRLRALCGAPFRDRPVLLRDGRRLQLCVRLARPRSTDGNLARLCGPLLRALRASRLRGRLATPVLVFRWISARRAPRTGVGRVLQGHVSLQLSAPLPSCWALLWSSGFLHLYINLFSSFHGPLQARLAAPRRPGHDLRGNSPLRLLHVRLGSSGHALLRDRRGTRCGLQRILVAGLPLVLGVLRTHAAGLHRGGLGLRVLRRRPRLRILHPPALDAVVAARRLRGACRVQSSHATRSQVLSRLGHGLRGSRVGGRRIFHLLVVTGRILHNRHLVECLGLLRHGSRGRPLGRHRQRPRDLPLAIRRSRGRQRLLAVLGAAAVVARPGLRG
mmetsp:Transcript_1229/g.3965  ORF Transcript_1229/g.3965 Transcript_1229/m.3965 type:complete len:492 (+) Transcript_1229:502-1977(+)